jgi:hypothetical protein
MATTTTAPIRSTQLERERLAADLVGTEVTYTGRVGSAHGRTFTVTASYDDRVTLTAAGEDRPTLSFVRLDKIAPAR